MRKVTVILVLLLSMVIVSGVLAVGQKVVDEEAPVKVPTSVSKYSEAPMLKERVASGELPAVADRLPKNPIVLVPVEEVGVYGSTWHKVYAGSAPWLGVGSRYGYEGLVRFDTEAKTVIPNVAESWEVKDGGKTFIFYLREGLKWSDGQPFTTEDIKFFFELYDNKEYHPSGDYWGFMAKGENAEITAISDYTIQFSFVATNPLFIKGLTSQLGVTAAPKHYLKDFFPAYTSMDKLEKMAKDEGFDTWVKLYQQKASVDINPELPTIRAWKVLERGDTRGKVVRNPYYWKVDTAGNQLPYIDYIVEDALGNAESVNMKSMMGEVDFQGLYLDFQNYTLFMENAEKGNYRVFLWEIPYVVSLFFNQNFKEDPILAKLLQNPKFRKALSLAINRDNINEFCYNGVGLPHQATAAKSSAYYKEEYTKRNIEYDPQKANSLLDEIGLAEKDSKGYRLRSDNKPVTVVIEPYGGGIGANPADVYELVKKDWEAVGIKTIIKTQENNLWVQRVYREGVHQIAAYVVDCVFWELGPRWFVPVNAAAPFAPLNGMWYESGGESGDEPTGDIKKLLDYWEEMTSATTNEEEIKAGQNIMKLHDENLWDIGLLRFPTPIIVKNYMRNVPEKGIWGWTGLFAPGYLCPEQFFIKK